MEKNTFTWDKEFLSKRLNLLTNFQLGFVGAALMLMMMNLSKIYLLLPLGIGLIFTTGYKSYLNAVTDEVTGLEVSFSPKSILIKIPAKNLEQRIQFREINGVTQSKKYSVPVVTLYLNGKKDKIELRGLADSNSFIEQLKLATDETD